MVNNVDSHTCALPDALEFIANNLQDVQYRSGSINDGSINECSVVVGETVKKIVQVIEGMMGNVSVNEHTNISVHVLKTSMQKLTEDDLCGFKYLIRNRYHDTNMRAYMGDFLMSVTDKKEWHIKSWRHNRCLLQILMKEIKDCNGFPVHAYVDSVCALGGTDAWCQRCDDDLLSLSSNHIIFSLLSNFLCDPDCTEEMINAMIDGIIDPYNKSATLLRLYNVVRCVLQDCMTPSSTLSCQNIVNIVKRFLDQLSRKDCVMAARFKEALLSMEEPPSVLGQQALGQLKIDYSCSNVEGDTRDWRAFFISKDEDRVITILSKDRMSVEDVNWLANPDNCEINFRELVSHLKMNPITRKGQEIIQNLVRNQGLLHKILCDLPIDDGLFLAFMCFDHVKDSNKTHSLVTECARLLEEYADVQDKFFNYLWKQMNHEGLVPNGTSSLLFTILSSSKVSSDAINRLIQGPNDYYIKQQWYDYLASFASMNFFCKLFYEIDYIKETTSARQILEAGLTLKSLTMKLDMQRWFTNLYQEAIEGDNIEVFDCCTKRFVKCVKDDTEYTKNIRKAMMRCLLDSWSKLLEQQEERCHNIGMNAATLRVIENNYIELRENNDALLGCDRDLLKRLCDFEKSFLPWRQRPYRCVIQ